MATVSVIWLFQNTLIAEWLKASSKDCDMCSVERLEGLTIFWVTLIILIISDMSDAEIESYCPEIELWTLLDISVSKMPLADKLLIEIK